VESEEWNQKRSEEIRTLQLADAIQRDEPKATETGTGDELKLLAARTGLRPKQSSVQTREIASSLQLRSKARKAKELAAITEEDVASRCSGA
jgi:hypothetical protein